MKVTAVTQPQSSCPFKSARQKIFGIGYALLVFVYDKKDDPKTNTAVLNILHALFVEERRTADFTMTRLIRQHLETGCNAEDLIGLMHDKNLPVDDIEANKIAAELPFEAVRTGFSDDFQRPSVAASVLAGDRRGGGSGWNSAVEVGWRQGGGAVARLTMTRKKERAEYGDFQTPPELARAVLRAPCGAGIAARGNSGTDLRSRQLSVRWLRPIHEGSRSVCGRHQGRAC